jgi:hypothetical protein
LHLFNQVICGSYLVLWFCGGAAEPRPDLLYRKFLTMHHTRIDIGYHLFHT